MQLPVTHAVRDPGRSALLGTLPSTDCAQPIRVAGGVAYLAMPILTTARTAAFMPEQSPPLVSTASRLGWGLGGALEDLGVVAGASGNVVLRGVGDDGQDNIALEETDVSWDFLVVGGLSAAFD